MQIYAICKMSGGMPVVPEDSYTGFSFIDEIEGWGGYLFSGDPTQIATLASAVDVYGFADVDVPIPPETIALFNMWVIPTFGEQAAMVEGMTYHDGVMALGGMLNVNFTDGGTQVSDQHETTQEATLAVLDEVIAAAIEAQMGAVDTPIPDTGVVGSGVARDTGKRIV